MANLLVDKKEEKNNKNDRKKTEETQPIFEGSYFGKNWRNLVEMWNAR